MKKLTLDKYGPLWFCLAIALLLRLFFLQFEYAAGWDEINYLKLGARGAISGFHHVLHPYWSPLYPFIIAVFGKVIPNYEFVGRMVSVLFGTLLIIPVYLFAYKYFIKKITIFCSLFIAIFPSLIESSVSALTESLYLFLTITGIILGFFALQKKSVGLAFSVGGFFSLAYLTRPEGIGLLIVFGGMTLCIAIYQLFKNHEYLVFVILIATILSFLTISSPYLYYLHQVTGKWTLSSKGVANLQGEITAMENKDKKVNPWLLLNEDNTSLTDDEIYHIGNFLKPYQSANQNNTPQPHPKVVKITPVLVVKKFMKNFFTVITTGTGQVLGVPIMVLMTLGLWGRPWDRNRVWRELYLLSYVLFFWFLVIPMFHITERYMLSMVPIILIWSGAGLMKWLEWFEQTCSSFQTNFNKRIFFILKGVFIFLFVGAFVLLGWSRIALKDPNSTDKWAEPLEQKKAGLWLKQHSQEIPVIMARSHAISYYAGNYNIQQNISIPHNKLDRVLAYARNRGAKYLALNEKNKDDFPTINYLLDERQAPPELKLIYKDDSVGGLKTVIYLISHLGN